MKVDVSPFRVREGETVKLKHRPTKVAPFYESRPAYDLLLAKHVAELEKVQQRHYAADSHAVLLIFQAMDAAGKDGVIRHVMSGVNPQGCQVFSFKHPSAEEVLIVRVHPEILQAEGVPDATQNLKKRWHDRYRSINNLERHLHLSGTKIVKFFLHLSKEEQRERFLARIEEPKKNWKFSAADIVERKFWDHYMTAYEDCLGATSTEHAPWYIVPADDKPNARLIVSQVIVDTLKDLKPRYPKTDAARRKELEDIREALDKE